MGQINDEEYISLASAGQPATQLNDMRFKELRDSGYEGALNDMEYAETPGPEEPP